MKQSQIKTKRLLLRPWRDSDFPIFAEMNADPKVMEFFPFLLSREESDNFALATMDHFEKRGWGNWAVSELNGSDFIGYIGLRYIDFPAPFTPAVEVGWRLAYDYWNKGYATEGALAALQYGFTILNLEEIISFTSKHNLRSIAVMKKIGMMHNEIDDFDHPKLPPGHWLGRHVLYRLNRAKWIEQHDKDASNKNQKIDS